jgi:hypothetical protein
MNNINESWKKEVKSQKMQKERLNATLKIFFAIVSITILVNSAFIPYASPSTGSGSSGGRISGKVTNNSGQVGYPVFVVCWNENNHYFVLASTSFTPYTYAIEGLPDGNYFVGAVVDSMLPSFPETRLKPQQGEAWGMYRGKVVISSGSIADNINIVINPLPTGRIGGTVSYNGAYVGMGALVIEAFTQSFFTNYLSYGWGQVIYPPSAQFPQEYTINYLADDPNYYVRAYIDLNNNLEHDPNEPVGETFASVSGGAITQGVNITINDPSPVQDSSVIEGKVVLSTGMDAPQGKLYVVAGIGKPVPNWDVKGYVEIQSPQYPRSYLQVLTITCLLT